jgi:DNA-binding LacI/PurR family transcriptional regulator
VEGVLRAAAQLGVEVRPELTTQLQHDIKNPGPSVPEEGYVTAQELLASGKRFTALFAFNDISAVGAVRAFRHAGFRPRIFPWWVLMISRRLTTVRQPLRRMGEMAAQQLLMRISNGNATAPQLITIAPEPIVRESTGPMRAS